MLEAPAPEALAAAHFPIVGVGASAGGLAAFEAFFSAMPSDLDPGLAFVLVQHLAPDHKSILTELIQRFTHMKVFEVEDGMRVQCSCAYIIPPNRDMALLNGALQLMEPSAPRGHRLPIDRFFRSLAQDQRERAICVVLSGTGSDGTLGVRAVKAEGGLVLAQDPASCEYDGMPRSAIGTGLVDFVLAPSEMPARLISLAAHASVASAQRDTALTPALEGALQKLFVLLRDSSGHDFSRYKPGTIRRRVERRMAVHRIATLDGYLKYAQQAPGEVKALFHDLLISVTSFFRDPEVFRALEARVLPQLLAAHPAGEAMRVWCAGCSTGEEAYSLAILLAEQQEGHHQALRTQVFATDLDELALARARAGLYPASVAADLTEDRLSRFFTLEADGSAYRVQKRIRELLVFSRHDLLQDPPFSRLDLISCRNLLIYLGAELQKKLLPLFHYALRPGGSLVLGTSESVGEFTDLFEQVEGAPKVYRRLEGTRAPRRGQPRGLPGASRAGIPRADEAAPATEVSLRALTERALLAQVAPAAALVDGRGDLLYLHGRTGQYLEPAPGEARVSNVLRMAREGLRRPLTSALRRAEQEPVVRLPSLRVRTNGSFTLVDLTVCRVPGKTPQTPLYLVVLAEASPSARRPPEAGAGRALKGRRGRAEADAEAHIVALTEELKAKEESLQATVEAQDTTHEELKSANEEMQSVNEELETSKEELESANEELATVNNELQVSVVQLSQSNNDMANLLAGNGLGTIFVDRQLNILRFTPAAMAVMNLISTDVGRPVSHIVTNLVGYQALAEDAKAVLDTLLPKEVEVQARAGAWYLLRIRPYRTQENVIEGVVITFVDITELRMLRQAERLAVVLKDAQDAITVQGLDGRILAWNPAAERLYGWTEAQALAMHVRERIPQAERGEALARLSELVRHPMLVPVRAVRLTRDGRQLEVTVTATVLVNQAGQPYAIATTERAVPPASGVP